MTTNYLTAVLYNRTLRSPVDPNDADRRQVVQVAITEESNMHAWWARSGSFATDDWEAGLSAQSWELKGHDLFPETVIESATTEVFSYLNRDFEVILPAAKSG